MANPDYWICDSEGNVIHGTGSAPTAAESEALRTALAGDKEEVWLTDVRHGLIHLLWGETPRFLITLSESRARSLSPRQREVAEYASVGATAPEIATQLDISVHTVRHHLKSIYERLGVACRVELRAALGIV